MNPDIRDRWVTALRSGEYTQGTGFLRSFEDEYCCLGVLCDLYNREHGMTGWTTPSLDGARRRTEAYRFMGDEADIDDAVSEWAELTYLQSDRLVHLNDSLRFSFDQIADAIESDTIMTVEGPLQ